MDLHHRRAQVEEEGIITGHQRQHRIGGRAPGTRDILRQQHRIGNNNRAIPLFTRYQGSELLELGQRIPHWPPGRLGRLLLQGSVL
jgi:hypothetical protein